MSVTAQELRDRTIAVWERVLLPPRRIPLSAWADAERRLSPEYSVDAMRARGPVRWSTARVPYLRAIMDALSDERIAEVTVAKASQVGATECGQNWLGWIIAERPSPTLIVYPTEKALRAFSTKRLDPMIRDTAVLAARLPRTARRESANAIASKQFPGGYLQLLTAKSTADLRSFSAALIIAEEVDEWEHDIGGQGDPLELLRARAATFGERAKLYKVSTPLIEGASRIWTEYLDSSQGAYHVPCPHCGGFQALVWQDPEGRYRLICERDAQGELVPESAQYACGHCGALIAEDSKPAMLAAGRWVHAFPERIPRHCGFHVNTLLSPFVSWELVMRRFLRATKNPAALKSFVTLTLGLPFREAGTDIEPHALMARVEPYAAEVPAGVGLLTAGVDVQGDRLELFVWGWGAGEEAWLIRWAVLDGDPGADVVWKALDAELTRPWAKPAGTLPIAAVAIDAGYQTERVWRFCEARRHRRVIPTIGREGRSRPLLQAPGPMKFKKSRASARPLYIVGVDAAKDLLLLSRLRITEPGPGYVHFPETIDPIFFEQLTAERLVTQYRRGRPVRTWTKPQDRRNEALDGSILALAALALLGPAVLAQLGVLASGPKPPPPPPAPTPGIKAQAIQRAQRRKTWVNRW